MPASEQQRRGRWAEARALALLRTRGWRPLARNWRCRWGELDLVCEKGGRLLLVEVKGRQPRNRDAAGTAVLRGLQRQRLRRAWSCWIAAHPECGGLPVEFVAALVPLPPGTDPVRWIRLEDAGEAGRND